MKSDSGSINMWVHGQTVVPYLDPDTSASTLLTEADHLEVHGRKEGWGAEFRSGSASIVHKWFQVAIPTPSFINDTPYYLDELTLLFRSNHDLCGIKQLDLWDGPNRTKWTVAFNPPLSGDFTAPSADGEGIVNRWKPTNSGRPIYIQYGLNLSVWVSFAHHSTFVFCAAGAQFIAP